MIGPILVRMFENNEQTQGLYYMYKSDISEGVASKEYIDGRAADDPERVRVVLGACYESYDEIFDHIAYINAKELRLGYPDGNHTYQLEYYPYREETLIKELINL